MRDCIASAAAAGGLAVVWACCIALRSHAGFLHILEGSLFLGAPAAFCAAAIAAGSRFLVRRLAWSLPLACALSGLALGALLGAGSAAGLRSDTTVTPAVWLQQISAFAGIGLALGVFVFGVLWTMHRRAQVC
ncbi:hypothetical protein [Tahibacter harae]|uniref:Uncharacterized protein n=1 Tax=Tahibacter harae TaxID=2963937 RepID=A0ABT1QVP7_9GAMM|nr:hypothetical protein [Tahibacter harae]MCQ4166360.1 hypothetical protein [Tahibacter harae]